MMSLVRAAKDKKSTPRETSFTISMDMSDFVQRRFSPKEKTAFHVTEAYRQLWVGNKTGAIHFAEQALENARTLKLSDCSHATLFLPFQLATRMFLNAGLYEISQRLFVHTLEFSPSEEFKVQLLEETNPEFIERVVKTLGHDDKHGLKTMPSGFKPSQALQLSLTHHYLDQINLDKKDDAAIVKSVDNALLAARALRPPQHGLMFKLAQKAFDLSSDMFTAQYVSLSVRAIELADPNDVANIAVLHLNLASKQILLDKKADAIRSAERALACITTLTSSHSHPNLMLALKSETNLFVSIEFYNVAERLFVRAFELSPMESRVELLEKIDPELKTQLKSETLNHLGEELAKSNASSDQKEAIQYYLLATTLKNSAAMFNMGMSYLEGRGVEINISEAVEWLVKSIHADHCNFQKSIQQLEKLTKRGKVSDAFASKIRQTLGILALENHDVERGFALLAAYTPHHLSTEHNFLVGLFIFSHFIDCFAILDNAFPNWQPQTESVETRQDMLFNLAHQHLTYAEKKSPDAKRLIDNIHRSHTEINRALGFKTQQPYRVYHVFNSLNSLFFKSQSSMDKKDKEQQQSTEIIKTIMEYCPEIPFFKKQEYKIAEESAPDSELATMLMTLANNY
jgi:tetratricopeptide (TPR) repeat protein